MAKLIDEKEIARQYVKKGDEDHLSVSIPIKGPDHRIIVLQGANVTAALEWYRLHDQISLAAQWLRALDSDQAPDDEKARTLRSALWQASIMAYGRCFVKAHGRKTLQISDVFKHAPGELLAVHKRMMEMRHQFIAHSSRGVLEGYVFTLEHDSNMPQNAFDLSIRCIRFTEPGPTSLAQMLSVVDFLSGWTLSKLNEVRSKIAADVERNIDTISACEGNCCFDLDKGVATKLKEVGT